MIVKFLYSIILFKNFKLYIKIYKERIYNFMDKNILLQPTKKSELTEFKKGLKESFEVAVIKEFGECNIR